LRHARRERRHGHAPQGDQQQDQRHARAVAPLGLHGSGTGSTPSGRNRIERLVPRGQAPAPSSAICISQARPMVVTAGRPRAGARARGRNGPCRGRCGVPPGPP
jgi:hypothetical protein